MKELTREQVASFRAKGYIRLEQVYSAEEMSEEMNYVMETLANWNSAWRGAWRKEYMDEAEDETTTLVAIHGLQHYSAPREIDQGQDPREKVSMVKVNAAETIGNTQSDYITDRR